MKNYNADDYEPVEARIKRFYADHKEGRILTYLASDPNNMDYAVFRAEIFVEGMQRSSGWSQAIRDKELTKSKKGFDYESVNYTSWLENAETSAVGRALANFGYQGSRRASREEMQKAGEREEVGEREIEQMTERITLLMAELEAEWGKGKGIVNDAWIDKMRSNMGKAAAQLSQTEFAIWLNKRIDLVRDEIAKQEALLKANTDNPAAAMVGKLQAAAEKTERMQPDEAKQGDLI